MELHLHVNTLPSSQSHRCPVSIQTAAPLLPPRPIHLTRNRKTGFKSQEQIPSLDTSRKKLPPHLPAFLHTARQADERRWVDGVGSDEHLAFRDFLSRQLGSTSKGRITFDPGRPQKWGATWVGGAAISFALPIRQTWGGEPPDVRNLSRERNLPISETVPADDKGRMPVPVPLWVRDILTAMTRTCTGGGVPLFAHISDVWNHGYQQLLGDLDLRKQDDLGGNGLKGQSGGSGVCGDCGWA